MSPDTRIAALALGAMAASILALGLVARDARLRQAARTQRDAPIAAAVRLLPAPDFALSGSARWLRMPSLEEPSAAFADGPACADPDPAGGAMAPPREAWLDDPATRSAP